MDNEKIITVPYIVHEGEMARMERMNRRLWIVILVLIAALIVTNAAWIYYENQFEDVSVSQEVQQETSGDGDNSFVGGDFNDETESKNDNKSSGKEKRQD